MPPHEGRSQPVRSRDFGSGPHAGRDGPPTTTRRPCAVGFPSLRVCQRNAEQHEHKALHGRIDGSQWGRTSKNADDGLTDNYLWRGCTTDSHAASSEQETAYRPRRPSVCTA
jgi:hypothetical protein